MINNSPIQQVKEDDFDEDEIDLVKLVSSSADVENQYIIFEGSNKEYYAINVAKAEELFVYQRDNIVHNNDKNNYIIGTADIRSHMTPLIYFDAWFGNETIEDSEYELLILCYFSSEYLGLIVKQVVDIISISPDQMHGSSKNNALTTFIAKITIGKESALCTIFDTDRLLFDLFGDKRTSKERDVAPVLSDKLVLFADDSKLVRKLAYDTFERLGVRFQLFEDGQELLDALENIKVEEIGIFLLDIEMPRKTGIDVIDALKQGQKYANIPIIVHTNMANASVTDTLKSKNVSKIIGKVDFVTIESAIREYMA